MASGVDEEKVWPENFTCVNGDNWVFKEFCACETGRVYQNENKPWLEGCPVCSPEAFKVIAPGAF